MKTNPSKLGISTPSLPDAHPRSDRPRCGTEMTRLAVLAPMTSKGTRRRALASPLAREELHCALRLPAPVCGGSVAPVPKRDKP
jgi:hypothetical protein